MPDLNAPLPPPRVALVGFGEAGEAFVRSPGWRGETRAWDVLPDRRRAMAAYEIETGDDAAAALDDRAFILSLVTADAALDAARVYAPLLPEGALWCDMNSVAPDTKREAAAAIEAAGVFDEVMASLDASEKSIGWAERVAYNRERMETHGLRRAAEMEESAKTLQGLGVEPVMTRGTVELQRRAAKPKHKGTEAA